MGILIVEDKRKLVIKLYRVKAYLFEN